MNDGVKHFHELEALTEKGNFEEALTKHIWFHEASRKFSGMGGVRLSYALDLWLDLAQKYPPAMKALVDLRNNYRELLLKGLGTFDNFHDLSAINQVLGESDNTYSVFVEIHKNYPEHAKRYYHVAEDLVVKMKAYDICAAYITDPIEKYSRIQHMHEMNVSLAKKDPDMDNDEFNEYTNESYTTEVCRLLEVMIALDKKTTAQTIQRMALEYTDNEAIRNAICF